MEVIKDISPETLKSRIDSGFGNETYTRLNVGGQLGFDKGFEGRDILFKDCIFNGKVNVSSSFSSLIFNSCDFKEGLTLRFTDSIMLPSILIIENCQGSNLILNGGCISEVKLLNNKDFDGELTIKNIKVKEAITIKAFQNIGNLYIESIETKITRLSDVNIHGETSITDSYFTELGLKNVVFRNDFKMVVDTVKNGRASYKTLIRDCVYRGGIRLGGRLGDFIFSDTQFEKGISFNYLKSSTTGKVLMSNCSGLFLNISNSEFEFFEIDKQSKFKQESLIAYVKVDKTFSISDGCSLNGLKVIGGEVDKLNLSNSNVYESLELLNARFKQIQFTGNEFHCPVLIRNVESENLSMSPKVAKGRVDCYITSILDLLSISGNFERGGNFKLLGEPNENSEEFPCKKLVIGELKSNYSIGLTGNRISDRSNIELLEFQNSQNINANMSFNKLKFETVHLRSNIQSGIIRFHLCSVYDLIFWDLDNQGKLIFDFLKFHKAHLHNDGPILKLVNADLGNSIFRSCDFSNVTTVKVADSTVTEIISINTNWFDSKYVIPLTEEETMQVREFYRQLKLSQENQGNRIQALEFKAQELVAFRSELWQKTKASIKTLFTTKSIGKNVSQLQYLIVNCITLILAETNGHGRYWGFPILLALISVCIFHILIIIGISTEVSFTLDLSTEGWHRIYNLWFAERESIPQLLNPTHTLKRIYPNANGWKVFAADYALKIILAFFIFQTVSAFRKFVKK